MSTSDDWERWLHIAGVTDDLADASASAPSRRHDVGESTLDDPWGDVHVALAPLTDDQRDHLLVVIETVLDELVELEGSDRATDGLVEGDGAGAQVASVRDAALAAAFRAIDEVDIDFEADPEPGGSAPA